MIVLPLPVLISWYPEVSHSAICPSPHCLPPWCSELASPRETLLSQLPTSLALVFQISCSIIFCSPLASSGTWLFTEATSSHYARHLSRCVCIVSSWVLLKILLDAPSQNHTSFSHRSIFSLPFWSYASTCTRCVPLGKPLTSRVAPSSSIKWE